MPRGEAWLETHPTQRPPALWAEFRDHLAEGFHHRCGYTAMYTDCGHVEHFRCQRDHRSLVYSWSNLRYCSGSVNSRKGCKDVLDPYEVQDDWFRLHYPSLQLVLTEAVPRDQRRRARRTLIELGLRDGEYILRARRRWLEMYVDGKLPLEGLRDNAPLIAAMVEREGLQPA